MDVFAYYDCSIDAPSVQPEWVPLWARSWRARGWNPRLITARHARRSKFYSKFKPESRDKFLEILALHAVGGGWLVPLNVINFSFKPCSLGGKYSWVWKHRHSVIQAPRRALEDAFRDGVFKKSYEYLPGLTWFDSPEEALKHNF